MDEILAVIYIIIGVAAFPTFIGVAAWVESLFEKRTTKKLLQNSRVRTYVEAYVIMQEKFEYYSKEVTKREKMIDKFIKESRFLPKEEWKRESEKLEEVRKEHFALLPDFQYHSEKLKNIGNLLREEIAEKVHPEDVDKCIEMCLRYRDRY